MITVSHLNGIFIILFLFFGLKTQAQEFNTYLLVKKKTTGKEATSKYRCETNEKLLGIVYGSGSTRSKMLSSYPDFRPVSTMNVQVLIDRLNFNLAGLRASDTAGINYVKLGDSRVAYAVIDGYGKFLLGPFYTCRLDIGISGPYLFGQKLKNGKWKAVSCYDRSSGYDIGYNHFPENDDYNLISPNLVLFKNAKGKFGLMDIRGNEVLQPDFDTFEFDFWYTTYPINSTSEVVTEKTKAMFSSSSLEENLNHMLKSPETYEMKQNRSYHYFKKEEGVFKMSNKEFTVLVSEKYITKAIKNAKVSYHSFGPISFYLLSGDNEDYDIINADGTKANEKYKYAYQETIKRDRTPGMFRKWGFDSGIDYSRPFTAINVDSVARAEKEKEKSEYQRKVKEKEDDFKKLEADPSNLTRLLKGSYSISSYSDNGLSLYPTYQTLFIGTESYNVVSFSIHVQRIDYQMNSEYSFNTQLSFTLSKTGDNIYLTQQIGPTQKIVGDYNLLTNKLKMNFFYRTSKGVSGFIVLEATKK